MTPNNYRYFLPNLAKLNRIQSSYSLIGEPIRSGELFQAKNQVPLVSNIKGSLIIDLANNTRDSDSTRLLRRFDKSKSIDILYEPYSIFIEDDKYPEVFPLEERLEKIEKKKVSARYEHFFLFNFIYRNFLQPLLTYDDVETNDGTSDLAIDYTTRYSAVAGAARCFGKAPVRQTSVSRVFGRLLRPLFLHRKLRSRPQKNMLFGRYDVVSARFFTNQRRLGNRFRLLGKNYRTRGSVYYWLAGFQHPYLTFSTSFPKFVLPYRPFLLQSVLGGHSVHPFFSGRLASFARRESRANSNFRSLLLPTYRGSSWANRARAMEFAFSLQRARTKLFAASFRLIILALENIPQIYNKTRHGRLNKVFFHQLLQKLSRRTGVFLNLTPYFFGVSRLNSARLSTTKKQPLSGFRASEAAARATLSARPLFRDRSFMNSSMELMLAQVQDYYSSSSLFENLLLPRLPGLGGFKRSLSGIHVLDLKQNEDELLDLEQEELDHWDDMAHGQFLLSEDFRVQRERTGQILRDFSFREAPLHGLGARQPVASPPNSFQVRLARLRALRHWPGGFASVLRHRRRFSRHYLLLKSRSLLA